MAKILLVVIAFAAFVCAEDDVEQKKRGAGKTTSLNSIPTGAQKPDYTYNIYQQNPSSGQSSPTSYQSSQSAYQSQVPNSFYPSQSNQYYTSETSSDSSYPQQPQISLIPPTTSSQFVPINFIPNSGYQAKYQLVPSKTSQGNLQLALVQQPANYPSPVIQYPQQLISPSGSQIQHQQSPFGGIPNGYFNVAPNYQPLAFGGPQIGHPSAMVLVPQANPSLYNNLLYPNPLQSFYNYYPSNSQAKYSVSYGTPQSSEGSQSVPKESSDAQNLDYASSDVNSSYKNAFTPSRGSSYTKLQ